MRLKFKRMTSSFVMRHGHMDYVAGGEFLPMGDLTVATRRDEAPVHATVLLKHGDDRLGYRVYSHADHEVPLCVEALRRHFGRLPRTLYVWRTK